MPIWPSTSCLIAPSLANLLQQLFFQERILTIALPQEQVDLLIAKTRIRDLTRDRGDPEAQTITSSDGEVFTFLKSKRVKKHCFE